jgi:hypothetical protein
MYNALRVREGEGGRERERERALRTDYGSSAYTIIFLKTLPGQ